MTQIYLDVYLLTSVEPCIIDRRDDKCTQNFWPESLKGKERLLDLGTEDRLVLKLILNKWDMMVWAGFI
jgi:hypothetical protein